MKDAGIMRSESRLAICMAFPSRDGDEESSMTINSEFLNGRCHQSQERDGPATRTGMMIAEAWEYIGLPARREMIVTAVPPHQSATSDPRFYHGQAQGRRRAPHHPHLRRAGVRSGAEPRDSPGYRVNRALNTQRKRPQNIALKYLNDAMQS